MNSKQKKSFIAAAGGIALMLTYPPYIVQGSGGNSNGIVDTGYALIFGLPDRATVDVFTLLVQWIGVVLLVLIGYKLFEEDA